LLAVLSLLTSAYRLNYVQTTLFSNATVEGRQLLQPCVWPHNRSVLVAGYWIKYVHSWNS